MINLLALLQITSMVIMVMCSALMCRSAKAQRVFMWAALVQLIIIVAICTPYFQGIINE